MGTEKPLIICAMCHETKPRHSRGMCVTCYNRAHRAGELPKREPKPKQVPKRKPRITKACPQCAKHFTVQPSHAHQVYCSQPCATLTKSKAAERVDRNCATCGKVFTLLASQVIKAGTGLYCSRSCIPRIKAEQVPRTCDHCGEYFTVRLTRLLSGKVKGTYCSLQCQRDSQKRPWGSSKSRPGVDTWRRAVLARDGHTCQQCGATDRLHAHHIAGWADYPDLRYVLSNGLTLCDACHFALHHPDIANPYAA